MLDIYSNCFTQSGNSFLESMNSSGEKILEQLVMNERSLALSQRFLRYGFFEI